MVCSAVHLCSTVQFIVFKFIAVQFSGLTREVVSSLMLAELVPLPALPPLLYWPPTLSFCLYKCTVVCTVSVL